MGACASQAPAKHGKADGAVKAAPASNDKPATDVVAGAVARAASQSTIHPIDTMKVRMQAGKTPGEPGQRWEWGSWIWCVEPFLPPEAQQQGQTQASSDGPTRPARVV